VPIPNNTDITVGILAANRNPEIWGPDSHEWRPERWLTALPDSVSAAHIPGVYSNLWVQFLSKLMGNLLKQALRMTFIGGGRSCMSV
jgi:cytochrome P450